MESRKITVVSTKGTDKVVLMSTATTLEEFKKDLDANHVDYKGMTFYEGLSKTELTSDNSILPHDVPYKGTTTNELVFMLTNMNKKIASGANMTRHEVYLAIKSNHLQSKCVEIYGKNFTTCTTAELEELLHSYTGEVPNSDLVKRTEAPNPITTMVVEDEICREALELLTKACIEEFSISEEKGKEILNLLSAKKTSAKEGATKKVEIESSYSDDALEDILKEKISSNDDNEDLEYDDDEDEF